MGAVFSAMKAEYVVVAEQAHPLGPASIHCLKSVRIHLRGSTIAVKLTNHAVIDTVRVVLFSINVWEK